MDHETFINLPNPVGSMGWQMEQQKIAEAKAVGFAAGYLAVRPGEIVELVLRLIDMKYDSKLISKVTDLSIEEIENLRK
jgi:hypothetical protein